MKNPEIFAKSVFRTYISLRGDATKERVEQWFLVAAKENTSLLLGPCSASPLRRRFRGFSKSIFWKV